MNQLASPVTEWSDPSECTRGSNSRLCLSTPQGAEGPGARGNYYEKRPQFCRGLRTTQPRGARFIQHDADLAHLLGGVRHMEPDQF